ncbi:hypothetical protein HDU98_011191 [Podochytrium sp. JEL0797]|nr:hypothetical protein HDU98_011191 [Podochytrium sp. JEL0797]
MAPVSETTLNYLRSAVDIAVMPGSESLVANGSAAVSSVSPLSVFTSGSGLLSSSGVFAGEAERLACQEQVFVAALHTGRLADARKVLRDLEARFPLKPVAQKKDAAVPNPVPSLRVAKLSGMLCEAEGDYDKALHIYEQALLQDETYVPIRKRVIAVLMDQDKTNDAITHLTNYLDHFHADLEAWSTLANLYLKQEMFQQAAFALEECMLMAGFNFLFHTRYAELMMTMGKYALALKYFCTAVEVTESNGGALRSWYGVRQASKALLDDANAAIASSVDAPAPTGKQQHKKAAAAAASKDETAAADGISSPEEWRLLNKLAGERIEAIYLDKKASTESIEVVKEWLKSV